MKKNLLSILILALMLVNVVLTSVMMISVMGTNKKTAQLVGDIATVLNFQITDPGKENVVEKVSLADTEVFNLTGSMTIPLKAMEGDTKTTYFIFDLALSMNTKHEDYKKYSEIVSKQEGAIKDAITTVVTSYTEVECRNDMDGVKAEILKAIQDLFDSDFIYSVSISGIKFG